MPCGKYRRDQFASQSEYESHREKLMRIILGPDWRDQSVSELIASHPELRQISLQELLHQAHHMQQDRPALPWTAEVIQQDQGQPDTQSNVVKHQPRPTDEPLAIEAPRPHQTAEEWLKQRLNANVPDN